MTTLAPIRLDRNEGARPDASLIARLIGSQALFREYPDEKPLEAALAARFSVDPERVVVTNGADGALERACRIRLGPGAELLMTNPTFEMAMYSFGWDSTFIQDAMFGCDQYQVGFNDMKYCNPDLDVLGEQIKVTVDQEERAQLMIQYSNIVNDDQPVGIINFSVAITAWNNRMHNLFPGPWGGPGIEYVWIEQ